MPEADTPPKPLIVWVLLGINGLFALLTVLFIGLFYTSGGDEQLRAAASAQQVSIATKDGAVSGTVRTLKQDSKEESKKTAAFDVGDDSDDAPQAAPQGGEGEMATVESLVATEEEAVATIRVNPRTAASLPEAPIEGLSEPSEFGALPKQGLTTTPLQAYGRPFTAAPAKPMVAIIVVDLGQQNTLTDTIISLPPDVTLALSPYSKDAALWSQSARNMGHETWLMLPVQPQGFPANDPGPLGIIAALKEPDLAMRMQRNLAAFPGYAGLVIPANEAISEHGVALEAIMKQTKERGLGLLNCAPSERGHATHLLSSRENWRMVADLVMDEPLKPEAIAKQFAALETTAAKKGMAIGVLHPYPVSVTALQAWMSALPQKSVQLVPLSALFLKGKE